MKRSELKIAIICFITTMTIYGASGAYTPFLSSYYQLNGLNKLQIGLISCIGPLVAITIQPIWGIISDRTGKRRRVLQLLALMSSVTMLMYFLSNHPLMLIINAFMYSSFSMAIIPLANAIITRAATRFDFDYAHVRLGGPIGHSLIPFLVSCFIVAYPRCMFIISQTLYLLLFVLITFMPEEMFDITVAKKQQASGNRLFAGNEVILIFALAVINTFGLSLVNTYLGPKLLDMGYSQALIGRLTTVLAVCELPVLMFVKRFRSRFSAMKMMSFTVTIAAVRLLLASSDSLILIIICQMIEGLTYMVAFYTAVTYISENCLPGSESRAQTLLVTLESGLGAIAASFLGGYLTSSLGTVNAFRLMAGVLIFLVVIINVIRNKVGMFSE